MKIKKEAITKFFRESPLDAHEFRDLMRLFGVGKAGRLQLKTLVDELVDEGTLVKFKGNRYGKAAGVSRLAGRLSTHRDGYGFVTPDEGGEDIFIPARYLRENMHGDRVEVRIVAHNRHGKQEGRIVETLERAYTRIVGRFAKTKSFGYVTPDEERITRDLYIPPGAAGRAENGQVVVAEITRYPTPHRAGEGRVVEVLGWPEDPKVEAETIIRKFDLPHTFPVEVLAAARAVSQTIAEEDLKQRVDLRNRLTVTIDGETARDFDDAVSVSREQGGRIRLWVSIADVSHYVGHASPLDAEAYLRGTSVYFPDRCIPMLPEELSNGICSLNPEVERLTLTAEILFDKGGNPVQSRFYPSVIRSHARLTYTAVKRILADGDPELLERHARLVPELRLMEELSVRLLEKRGKRGSIDFDLPEPQVVLDLQGQTEAIIRAERNVAHRIIEEFMLAANEAVAGYIEGEGVPSLYRIHETPDLAKLAEFSELIRGFGYEFRIEEDRVEPGEFQRLLVEAQGKPEEKMINEMLLRSMKQARYAAENLGHFGLAAPCYTHFTSPIRRYPDLVVHRILKRVLAGKMKEREIERLAETLPEVAVHTSNRERVAMEAEREIVRLKKVQFMRDKVGEEFDGFITGVTAHGFFVELVELFVEGMVHVSTLPSDFYRYLEKQHALAGERGRTVFRIGDRVRVRVAQVSTERKQIDFVLAESKGSDSGRFMAADEEYPKLPVTGKRLPRPHKRGRGRKG
ncbi:MAG TPA: ribonuclease R [Geobacteraceae bacterium]